MGFRKAGSELNYEFVSGARAVYMSGSISTASVSSLENHFRGNSERENFSCFLKASDPRIILPEVSRSVHFSKGLLRNLLDEIYPRLLDDANYLLESEFRLIHEVKSITKEARASSGEVSLLRGPRPYRLRTDLPGNLVGLNQGSETSVVNMNENGILLRLRNIRSLEGLHKMRDLSVNLQGNEFRIRGSVVRVNLQPISNLPGSDIQEIKTPEVNAEVGFKLSGGNELLHEILSTEPQQQQPKIPLKIAS